MEPQADKFGIATPLLTLQTGSQTCLYCGCVILARELTNNVTESALEKLQKDGGIAQQWSKVQPGGKWRTSTFLVRRKTIPRRY